MCIVNLDAAVRLLSFFWKNIEEKLLTKLDFKMSLLPERETLTRTTMTVVVVVVVVGVFVKTTNLS